MNFSDVIRNSFGAVFYTWTRSAADRDRASVGLAFCNPQNFPGSNWSRDEWMRRGMLIADGRLAKKPIDIEIIWPICKRNIRTSVEEMLMERAELPDGLEGTIMSSTDLSEQLYLNKCCRPQTFGLAQYRAGYRAKRSAFSRWMILFICELKRQKTQRKQWKQREDRPGKNDSEGVDESQVTGRG